MRSIINKTLLLTFLLFGIYFRAIAQQPSDSLWHYQEIAAKNNPAILQKFSEYKAALQKVAQAGSLPDPELSVGVFISPMEVLSGEQVADIRLMQMFPWFGVLENAKDEMSLMAKAKYESFREARSQVFYNVQRTWYELYKNQQEILISEKAIGLLRSIERLTLVKFKAVSTSGSNASSIGSTMSNSPDQNTTQDLMVSGSMGGNSTSNLAVGNSQTSMANSQFSMGSNSNGSGLADLYRIQIEISELEYNISQLKNQQTTIGARFNAYLNRPLTSFVTLPDSIKPKSPRLSLMQIPDSILVNNPMLNMLQHEKNALEARKKMVSRMSYPMVGLGLNYSVINKSNFSTTEMNGQDMIMPMISVSIPLYRDKYNAMEAEVDLMKSATEYGYQSASKSLQAEYYDALQLYQNAEQRMILYSNQSQLVQKTLDILTKNYSTSGTGLTDLLRVRQQLLDYELKKIQALTEFNSSIALLERLMAVNNIQ